MPSQRKLEEVRKKTLNISNYFVTWQKCELYGRLLLHKYSHNVEIYIIGLHVEISQYGRNVLYRMFFIF